MTAKVNLLPHTSRESAQQAVARGISVGVIALAVVALGATYLWLNGQVNDAEERLLAAEATTAELRAAEGELVLFADLADRRDEATERLVTALSGEVSIAGFLQDVALVQPSDAQLNSLTVTIEPFDPEVDASVVGSFTATGQTLTSHAPGVERLLLQFDKIGTISEPFATSSVLDDPEETIATFSMDGSLNASALTRRYQDGLPEGLR